MTVREEILNVGRERLLALVREGYKHAVCHAILENYVRSHADKVTSDPDTVASVLKTIDHVNDANAEYFIDDTGRIRWDILGVWVERDYPPIETIRPEGNLARRIPVVRAKKSWWEQRWLPTLR